MGSQNESADSHLRMIRQMIRRHCSALIFIFVALSFAGLPQELEGKAWLTGHIVELRPDGLILQTRYYPDIIVRFAAGTVIRCKKRFLKVSDLELHDLVTVEGRNKHGTIDAAKVTIHRDWLKCREIQGAKPAHCGC